MNILQAGDVSIADISGGCRCLYTLGCFFSRGQNIKVIYFQRYFNWGFYAIFQISGSIWDVNKPIPVVRYGWGDLPLKVTFLT